MNEATEGRQLATPQMSPVRGRAAQRPPPGSRITRASWPSTNDRHSTHHGRDLGEPAPLSLLIEPAGGLPAPHADPLDPQAREASGTAGERCHCRSARCGGCVSFAGHDFRIGHHLSGAYDPRPGRPSARHAAEAMIGRRQITGRGTALSDQLPPARDYQRQPQTTSAARYRPRSWNHREAATSRLIDRDREGAPTTPR